MTKIGFVGVGNMGQAAHLRNYATLPDCRVVAIAEVRPKLAQAVAQRYDVSKVYEGFEPMLEHEDLDAIVAIQPFELHGHIVPEILKKGVPVITEKPLADSISAGKRVLEAAERTKTPLYIAYNKRSDPATAVAKTQILRWKATGEVGALRYIRITMPPGDWSREGFANIVTTDETYDNPGGKWDAYQVFVNYYIHQVNLFRFLLGEDFDPIFADPSGVTMTIRSKSGVTGTLEMAPYSTSIDWQEGVLVAFERGWIKLDLPPPMVIDQPGRVTVYQDGNPPLESKPSLPHWHSMRMQARHFVDAVQGKEGPLCGPEDAMKDLSVAERYIELLGDAR